MIQRFNAGIHCSTVRPSPLDDLAQWRPARTELPMLLTDIDSAQSAISNEHRFQRQLCVRTVTTGYATDTSGASPKPKRPDDPDRAQPGRALPVWGRPVKGADSGWKIEGLGSPSVTWVLDDCVIVGDNILDWVTPGWGARPARCSGAVWQRYCQRAARLLELSTAKS